MRDFDRKLRIVMAHRQAHTRCTSLALSRVGLCGGLLITVCSHFFSRSVAGRFTRSPHSHAFVGCGGRVRKIGDCRGCYVE